MPIQSQEEIAAITQAVNRANTFDEIIEAIATQKLLLARDGAELDKNKMIIRLRQIKDDKLILQAVAQGQYPWQGSELTSNYNLRSKIEEVAQKAWTKLNAIADDSYTKIESIEYLASDDDEVESLPEVRLAAPFRYVPQSQAVPPNADFTEFKDRLGLIKWHTPSAKLSTLLTQAARERIIDYFLVDTDPSVAAHFSGTQQLNIRREMANIAALKPGEAYRLDKKITGLPRTLNVLRGDDGQYMLIVETKSKLADDTKQTLPKIGGATKTGKPAWRIDAGEVEYFNLVAIVRDQRDIIELRQEVDLSKKMASPEVQQNVLGAKFTNKGQEKISVYSVKADDSLETLVQNGTTAAQSPDQQDMLILELLQGVKIFHDQGYAHQDLKPGNILVYGDAKKGYHLKLTDFGLVRKSGTNEDALATAGYQSPEISYYHSHPSASQYKYYGSAFAAQTLAHIIFQYNPAIYPADGSGRNAVRTPDISNDMWSLGIIAFEIRYGRQPNTADWPTIQADPLLKALLTYKANRIDINKAIDIHSEQMVLKMAALSPKPTQASTSIPSLPLPPVPKRPPPLSRGVATRQLVAPPVQQGQAKLLNTLPAPQAPKPERPPLRRVMRQHHIPMQPPPPRRQPDSATPLPPSGTPPRSLTPPPPSGTPPGPQTPPPPPTRGSLQRANAIKSLRQPQDALSDLLAKAPKYQVIADPYFAAFIDAITLMNSAQGKLIPKEEQAKCLYALLSMIQLPPKVQSGLYEARVRFIKDNKAFLENQFPQAIKPLKTMSNDEMKKVAEGAFQPQKVSKTKKLGE